MNCGKLKVFVMRGNTIEKLGDSRSIKIENEISRDTSEKYAEIMLNKICGMSDDAIVPDSMLPGGVSFEAKNGMRIGYNPISDELYVTQMRKRYIRGFAEYSEMESYWRVALNSLAESLKSIGEQAKANIERLTS